MTCAICRCGETRIGTATVTLNRNELTVVFRGVPARVCDNCGEEYVDETTTSRLLRIAEEAGKVGVLVDVRQYVAA